MTELQVAYVCGTVATVCAVAQYVPQLLLNHRRRSTVGLSASSIVLKLVGASVLLFSALFLGEAAPVVLYGLGVPLSTVGLAVWAADFGGEARVAQLVQQLQLSYAIGSLLLSTMPGMIADRTGSYAPAYLVLLACSVVSILAVQRTYLARAKS